MSFRTTLIIINLAAVLGLLIFIAYRVVSLRRNPEPRGAREPHAVLRRRRPRRSPPRTCPRRRAGLVGGLRRRARRLLHLGAVPRGRRDRRVQGSLGGARRGALCRPQLGGVRQLEVAQLRPVPRRRRPGRVGPAADQEHRPALRPRPDGRRGAGRGPALLPAAAGELGGAQPHARAVAVQPRAAHADHHLRPAGYADARMGREERQGRAQRAEHPRPRELPVQHQHHAREGAGRGGRRTPTPCGRPSRATRCGRRRRSGWPTPPSSSSSPRPSSPRSRATASAENTQHRQQRRRASHRERRGRARVAADHVGRDRGQHPVHGQLRALPHARLVVLRSRRPAGESRLPARWVAAPSDPTSREGDVDQQFPSPLYDADFFGWISAGVPAFEAYGIRGISSGRMPHFGAVLTKEQIEAIMEYERSL